MKILQLIGLVLLSFLVIEVVLAATHHSALDYLKEILQQLIWIREILESK